MSHPIHHFHKRKRIHTQKEKYPSKDSFKRVVDKLIYFFGLAAPFAAIPQVYKIYTEQNASSISSFTFTALLITNFFWVLYGILHKEKPIIAVYIAWIVINSLIVTGTILYG
ncbi:hypothetical protein KKG22_00030 [Patescibacteria group bacterium]|nr:hypothetical protein [Patescibacteria group bacterium]MBU1721378.1 hypothetical protein [Patescibacteria group bacterium]MBU1900913.1 hypothetical protein [Patescibacteria group bacterium]